jgi:hypothetical protein
MCHVLNQACGHDVYRRVFDVTRRTDGMVTLHRGSAGVPCQALLHLAKNGSTSARNNSGTSANAT